MILYLCPHLYACMHGYLHQEGCTPLHRACEHGWIDSVRFLTSAGANIDAVDKVHSDTDDDALHAACSVL